MGPFYGSCSTASRLEPLRGGSWLKLFLPFSFQEEYKCNILHLTENYKMTQKFLIITSIIEIILQTFCKCSFPVSRKGCAAWHSLAVLILEILIWSGIIPFSFECFNFYICFSCMSLIFALISSFFWSNVA